MEWESLRNSLSRPSAGISAAILVAWILHLVGLAVYRLFLSPIAKFPGPKLAALTRWYEAYYEIPLSGQYSRKIDELHDKYGPIIRVAPNEIHIRDSHFFDQVYAKNPRVEKPGWEQRFGTPYSVFTTVDSALHRRRRAPLNPMFSRRSIMTLEPVIKQNAEVLCRRLAECAGTSQILRMDHVYPAFTGDIILEYSFGFSYHQLESPNFDSFHEAFMAMGSSGHLAARFPWFLPVMNLIPDKYVEKIQPATASLMRLKRDLWDMIGRTIRNQDLSEKELSHVTVFTEILQSGLPPEEKRQFRMHDDVQAVVGAGIETTAFALTVGTYHIVNTPRIYQRLHEELVQAFPDAQTTPNLFDLEKLPYLKACIQESLRLSYGLSARNPRRHDRPLQYGEWTIPPRTTVAMTIVDVHHDEDVFPDSHSFIPERWLDSPRTADGTPLEHYLVSFGRGPRVCLGMNLAWAELYFAMGMVFRRFKFELYQTDVTDVRLKHDFFTPRVKHDSRGMRVRVSDTCS